MKAKKTDVSHKLKVARGQLDGILKMVDENRYCVDISNQLLATQALLKSANQEIMQAHGLPLKCLTKTRTWSGIPLTT